MDSNKVTTPKATKKAMLKILDQLRTLNGSQSVDLGPTISELVYALQGADYYILLEAETKKNNSRRRS